MNRCAPLLLMLALSGLASAQTMTVPAPATTTTSATDGQSVHRNFPQNALRGQIVFGTPPVITMNGVVTRMGMGYRIHGPDNLLVMSAQLVGGTAVVDYTTDVEGRVLEIWILSTAEISKVWPTTRAQAAAWTFDPIAQTWTQP
jgi:hypothetical protein